MIKNLIAFIKTTPVFAVSFMFATSSLLFGTWVASIPAAKAKLDFTDGGLGLSLLLSPLGAITGMLLSTRVFSKISVGRWMVTGYPLMAGIMVLLINAVNRPMFWVSLYALGVVSFLNGVASNATVNLLEKKYNRLFMSTCHAMYSLGGATSAGLAVLLFSIRLQSGWHIVIVGAIVVAVIFSIRHLLLQNTDIIHSRSGIKLPSATILGISFICMVTFMAEGCVADWSAIYLKEVLHSPKALISLGYAGFCIAMTFGRLNGDVWIAKTGSKRIVMAGSMLAAIGFTIVVLAPTVIVAIMGYILVGLGCSCIVPVLFSASANIPGLTTVEGYAMVTTGGLIGFLTGPSIIGFISEKSGLAKGLSLLILLALTGAVVAWQNKFLVNKTAIKEVVHDEQVY